MKKILSLITVAGLTLALTVSAFAQAAGPKGGAQSKGTGQKGQAQNGGMRRLGGGMGMGRNSEEMYKKLGITAAQKTKIEALRKKFQADTKPMQDEMKKAGQDRAAARKIMDKYRPKFEKFQKDFMAILTPAQRTKLEQINKEQRAQWEKMRNQRGGAAGGNKTGGTAKKGGGTAKGGTAKKGG